MSQWLYILKKYPNIIVIKLLLVSFNVQSNTIGKYKQWRSSTFETQFA